MAWTAPTTRATGDIITAAIWNTDVVDNLAFLGTHAHSGASGDGSASLGPLVQTDFTDAAAPAAPGAGKTRVYSVSGRLRTRAGAGGADSQLVSSLDGTARGDLLFFNASSAWARLAAGTSGQFLKTLGAGADPAWAALPTITTIAESVLGADAANVDFTSIPATYRHLMIVIYGQSALGADIDTVMVRFNGSSAANYENQRLRGSSTTASAAFSTGQTSLEVGVISGRTIADDQFGACVIWIPGYADSAKLKAAIGMGISIRSALAAIELSGGHNTSITAALNQVTVFPGAANWKAGTIVTLYGLPTA